jgi:flavin-dependent dehydrogenase
MMSTQRFDAIIIGAGPAGASAAILLARAGWSVVLVEKQNFPRRKVCGECLAASNLPLLQALGLYPAFAATAGPQLRQVALMQGDRTVSADLPVARGALPADAWGRALGRETLDTWLLDGARAAGVQVLQPWLVQAIAGAAGDYRCDIRRNQTTSQGISDHTAMPDAPHSATLQAPVLIAAHGSWEHLPARRAARRGRRRPSDLFAFKANFANANLDGGVLPVLAFKGGYGGMVVADQSVTTLACCIRQDRLDACRREAPGFGAGESVERLLRRECVGVALALQGAERQGAWLASGPIDPGIRLHASDTLFRIGNAAGEAHPIIGEGISMAMQSAWLLCAELLKPGRESLPHAVWQQQVQVRYARQWRSHFAPRLRLAAGFAHLAMRPALAAALMAVVRRWPSLLTHGARWGGKVDCAVGPEALAWLGAGKPSTRTGPAYVTPEQPTMRAEPGAINPITRT